MRLQEHKTTRSQFLKAWRQFNSRLQNLRAIEFAARNNIVGRGSGKSFPTQNATSSKSFAVAEVEFESDDY